MVSSVTQLDFLTTVVPWFGMGKDWGGVECEKKLGIIGSDGNGRYLRVNWSSGLTEEFV